MILQESCKYGLEEMDKYIVPLLAKYKPKVNGQFLCIVYSPDMKSFKYKLFCPQEEK